MSTGRNMNNPNVATLDTNATVKIMIYNSPAMISSDSRSIVCIIIVSGGRP